MGIFWGVMVGVVRGGDNGAVAAGETPAVTELTRDYLDGKWDLVGEVLRAHVKDFTSLPVERNNEREDVNAIRVAYSECRQGWWSATKLGNKVLIHPSVWNRPMVVTYDPEGKSAVQFQNNNGRVALTVTWNADDMDSEARGEHGFTKGELAELGAWMTLGNADGWSMIPQSAMMNETAEGRLAITRFMDFRSSVAGAYYGSPRVRRWALFLYLNTYEGKYAKMESAMSRKAIGALMVAEVVGNPGKYPSIPLPTVTEENGAEEKCAEQIKGWIEKHGWTLGEDRKLREMLKLFAAVNGDVFRLQTVVLQNKLVVALDPEKDKVLSGKRDAWIVKQLGKGAGGK